jgi:hypothetical protein
MRRSYNVDCAVLQKLYWAEPEQVRRHSPPNCIGTEVSVISDDPDPKPFAMQYIEHRNLTLRMSNRYCSRLPDAFSIKVENLIRSVSPYFTYYHFCRPHTSLKGKTRAMAAGLALDRWERWRSLR